MKLLSYAFAVVLALPLFVAAETGETAVTPTEPTGVETVAAPAGLEVLEAGLGTGVENRVLVGEAASFDTAVTQIYCLTKIQAASTPATVKHVWSVDGKVVADVPLAVNGSPWRTFSRKTVWPGTWKVEIQDEAGAVLKALECTVTEAAPVQPAQ